ncbi:MAG: nucleoside diphosphate kinase regulator [Phycisphaerae bacterium]|nr:nucleoside diphosphate kinase regulator [Phycisphaerae bacterium]
MGNKKTLFITKYDYERLTEMLKSLEKDNSKDQNYIEKLKNEIEKAKMVSSDKVPRDIVTMNSRFMIEDLKTHEELSYQIVFPSDIDLDAGKISVLSPIGTALLGYKVGDIIEWQVPKGKRKFKVKKMLYQPEFEGNLYE